MWWGEQVQFVRLTGSQQGTDGGGTDGRTIGFQPGDQTQFDAPLGQMLHEGFVVLIGHGGQGFCTHVPTGDAEFRHKILGEDLNVQQALYGLRLLPIL